MLNSGSSSLKYQLVDRTGDVVAAGIVERIGEPASATLGDRCTGATPATSPIADHDAALRAGVRDVRRGGRSTWRTTASARSGTGWCTAAQCSTGPRWSTTRDRQASTELSPLAPLHNPPNVLGIEVARRLLPDVPHVAVFDTAFFHDLPRGRGDLRHRPRDRRRARQIRRYGFHGTSHQYVSEQAAAFLGGPLASLNQIVLHLGNGASASAIVGGRPVDTSMGLTPLEGLVMGTRSGDIDPGLVMHLWRTAEMSVDEIDDAAQPPLRRAWASAVRPTSVSCASEIELR